MGEISDDENSGGRIDIVIKQQNGKEIVIENKINARDQKKQLIRYKNHYPNAHILYLTLDGATASTFSIDNNLEYTIISYEYDIIRWLEHCKKEAVNHSTLRETITQYINLIKLLTGQNLNLKMSKEIIDIFMTTYSNFKSAEVIGITYKEAISNINDLFWKEVEYQSKEEKQWIEWNNYKIHYIIDEDGGGIYFGLIAKTKGEGEVNNDGDELKPLREISVLAGGVDKSSPKYLGWTYTKKYKNFYDSEVLFNLFKNDYRQNYVAKVIKESQEYFHEFTKRVEEANSKN